MKRESSDGVFLTPMTDRYNVCPIVVSRTFGFSAHVLVLISLQVKAHFLQFNQLFERPDYPNSYVQGMVLKNQRCNIVFFGGVGETRSV